VGLARLGVEMSGRVVHGMGKFVAGNVAVGRKGEGRGVAGYRGWPRLSLVGHDRV
jgi:hypothetical protein